MRSMARLARMASGTGTTCTSALSAPKRRLRRRACRGTDPPTTCEDIWG